MNKKSASYRKYMATGLATAIVAAAVPVAVPNVSAAANEFSDVNTNAWYYNNVDYLVEKGVLGGYTDGTLRPTGTLTRAEAATMLVGTLGISTKEDATLNFTDTKNGVWYTAPIAALVEKKIVNGFPDGSFRPNATVTRAEFAAMVTAAYMINPDEANMGSFPDVVPNSWYEGAVQTLVSNGIVGGRPNGKFDPSATVLRAESAAFIHRTEVVEERLNYVEEDVELSIGSVQASTNETAVTTVTADVAGAKSDAQATVEIFTKGNTTKEPIAKKVVDINKKAITADFKELVKGDYVARVTIGTGKDAVTAEQEFTVDTLVVKSVKGATSVVDAGVKGQSLLFTVNGEALSYDYLKKMGYELEFLVSKKGVLKDTATGELNENNLTPGESFDYQVKVTGNDVALTSSVETVNVENFSASIVSIKGAELLFNDSMTNKSGVLSTSDKNSSLANIEVTYKDGKTTKLAADHQEENKNVFTYSSSDQTVALIDKNGDITPISDGSVTFTIKTGSVEHSVKVKVSTEDRKASKAEVSKDAIGLVAGGSDNVALTVTDQFGDTVKGFAEAIAVVNNKDEKAILTAAYEPNTGTNAEGKVVINVKADPTNEGTGTLTVKNKNGDTLTSLKVTVDADLAVATRALELVNPAQDQTLDVNKFDTEDRTLGLVMNEYNKSGLKIGGHDLSQKKYTIASTNDKVLTVSGTDAKDGKFVANAVGGGTAKVQVKEGSIVRYETEITVVDTTPKLAGATFISDVKVTSTDALNVEDIIDSLTFSGEKGDAKVTYSTGANNKLVISLTEGNITEEVATLTAFSVNVSNAGFFENNNKFYLGEVVKKAGFDTKTEGAVVLRLNRTGENNAMITTTVDVNVK